MKHHHAGSHHHERHKNHAAPHKHHGHEDHRHMDEPLRDWSTGSYHEDGRCVSSLDRSHVDPQIPRNASMGVSGAENAAGSGDKSRRNK